MYAKDARSRIARLGSDGGRVPLPLSLEPLNFYSTTFPATENPMSEYGVWTQGAANGIAWTNVRTTTNKAFGTQDGLGTAGDGSSPGIYNDSIAALRGTWGANQQASGVAFNTRAAGDYNTELELLLRWSITANSATGYEVEYSCRADNPYFDIVRWNGAIGDFTPLTLSTGGTHLASMPGGAIVTGDVITATIVGNLISAYRNGILIATATDSTYTTGRPGLGHYLHNITQPGDPTLYGYTSYTAQTIGSLPPGLGAAMHMQPMQSFMIGC